MFEKLNKTYGMKLTIASEKKLSGIPIYMVAGRKMYEVQYGALSFLLICVSEADRFGSIALEKQLAIYQKAAGMPAAYAFEKLTNPQRSALLKRQIPFISEPDQVYLPFMGVMLRNSLNKKSQIPTDKMMPATQSLFLYLVYHKEGGCLKKDAADSLGLTRTSISRASEQLTAMGLIREERKGREIRMYLVYHGREIFEYAKPYLINPVQKTVFAKDDAAIMGSSLSGESALGSRTMLNQPKVPVYAVDKSADLVNGLQTVDPQWDSDDGVCRIEIWKYDPGMFSSEGAVDPISLAMTFENQDDERIEGAMDEYMENWKW